MSEGIVGPNSPKKKFHAAPGKGSLEDSIHNVKPLDLNAAHAAPLLSDGDSSDPSDSSNDEVILVEESSDDDASSYEEVVEEEIVEEEEVVEEEEEVEEDAAKPTRSAPAPASYKNDDDDDDHKELGWKKPDWTKKAPLRTTEKGQVVKEGANIAVPVTNIRDVVDTEKQDLAWKKPDWTKNVKLKSTGKGDKLKTEGNLAKPITNLPHIGKDFDKDEPGAAQFDEHGKKIEWEKPDWTKKPVLKTTQKGEKVKSGETISRPIGGIKPVRDNV